MKYIEIPFHHMGLSENRVHQNHLNPVPNHHFPYSNCHLGSINIPPFSDTSIFSKDTFPSQASMAHGTVRSVLRSVGTALVPALKEGPWSA